MPTKPAAGEDAEAVVLDLMKPHTASGRYIGLGGETRRDEAGGEHTRHDRGITATAAKKRALAEWWPGLKMPMRVVQPQKPDGAQSISRQDSRQAPSSCCHVHYATILPSSTAHLNVRPSSALDDGLYFGQAFAALRHRVPSRHSDVVRP
jgi:hypothetical protein